MTHIPLLVTMIVPADKSEPVRVREVEYTLKHMQALVGGSIGLVPLVGCTAYCNEEGKINRLPYNERATELALHLGWEPLPGDVLVGDVVFCGPADDEGNDSDVPPDVVDAWRQMERAS